MLFRPISHSSVDNVVIFFYLSTFLNFLHNFADFCHYFSCLVYYVVGIFLNFEQFPDLLEQFAAFSGFQMIFRQFVDLLDHFLAFLRSPNFCEKSRVIFRSIFGVFREISEAFICTFLAFLIVC